MSTHNQGHQWDLCLYQTSIRFLSSSFSHMWQWAQSLSGKRDSAMTPKKRRNMHFAFILNFSSLLCVSKCAGKLDLLEPNSCPKTSISYIIVFKATGFFGPTTTSSIKLELNTWILMNHSWNRPLRSPRCPFHCGSPEASNTKRKACTRQCHGLSTPWTPGCAQGTTSNT